MDQYTIGDFIHAFRRRAKVFSVIVVAFFGAAMALAISWPDYYRSTAELHIDLQGLNVGLKPVETASYADQYVKSLQQKVLTYDHLRDWLKNPKLYARMRKSSTEDGLVARMRRDLDIRMVTTGVSQPDSGKEIRIVTGFTTSFEAPDPESAHFVASKLAQTFLDEDKATRVQKASAAASFLQSQIKEKRAEINKIQGKIADFKQKHADTLPDMMTLNQTVLERAQRDLADVENEIDTTEQDRIFRKAQLQKTRGLSPTATRLADLEDKYLSAKAVYGPDYPDVIRMRRQIEALAANAQSQNDNANLADLEDQLAELRQRYSDQYPDVVSLRRRIAALKKEQKKHALPNPNTDNLDYLQLRAQVNALDTKLQGLRQREKELRQKVADTEDMIAQMPQVERDYTALQTDLQTAQAAFDDLRQRANAAEQTESFESGKHSARLQLVRSASTPKAPAGPPRAAITVLGLLLAVTLGGGAALGTEALDRTIRGAKDIQMLLEMRPIVAIPVVENSVSRIQRRRRLFLTTPVVALAALIGFFALVIYLRQKGL